MTDTKTTIYQALGAVQAELKAPKGQRNTFGNYNYRSCEDILEAVKPLLAKHGLVLELSDELVNIGERYYVKAQAFVSTTSGPQTLSEGLTTNSLVVSAYAREEETKKGMDGAQITGASSSYARKYALNGLFLIDDTKDADTDEHHRQESVRSSKSATNESAAPPNDDEEKVPCEVVGCYSGVRLSKLEINHKYHKGHTICYLHSTNGDWESNLPQDDEGPTAYDMARNTFDQMQEDK